MTTHLSNDLELILEGIKRCADVITTTMGGSGKNVILSSKHNIAFTKDGVSVARSITLPNELQNIGAQLLINASNKTVQECGDGTTLTACFISEFARWTMDYLKNNENVDINDLIVQIKSGIDKTIVELKQRSKKIKSNSDIYNVALTSSKSTKVAKLIADIYKQVGKGAYISVENSENSPFTYPEITTGLNYEKGMLHPKFANKSNGTCVFENCMLLVYDGIAQSPDDFKEIIAEHHNSKTPILMMADHFSDAFVRFCITNVVQQGLQICLINTPGYGDGKKQNLKDIRAFVNTDGTVNKIVVSPYETTIFNNPNIQTIKNRIDSLKHMISVTTEKWEEKDFIERINKLNQSCAIIYVGGITEKNRQEEYDRIEDAVGAVRTAIQHGYVRGCGIELYNIGCDLKYDSIGEKIVEGILYTPHEKILQNSNLANKLIINKETPYNVRTHQYDNTLIDPTNVLISSLLNSWALIELLINTSYIVYND